VISRDAKNLFIPVSKDCGLPCFQHRVDTRTTAPHLRGSGSGHSGLPLEYNDTVSQVRGHDEVVLDDERCLLSVEDVSVRHKDMSPPGVCEFCRGFAYLLIILLAIMRCSESKKLNDDLIR
jgi:hypothetical protein